MAVDLRPTWPKIIALGETVTGRAFTRQALSAHESIATAYDAAVARHHKLRKNGPPPEPKPQNDSLDAQRIAELEAENERQRELIDALQDMLVRFVGNAVTAGVSQERLEAPLPARAEWRSDVDDMADRTKEARRKQRRGS
ncbi:MAG: hypothetical protein P0Y64_05725 [Candidatus Sphingomonas colombiensis]|nr:hypothetical protein [Sphingomonas sp.]WEK44307.1 MAG: hypothetical protein P0Y64_05725 [Sphingomonas sp.]